MDKLHSHLKICKTNFENKSESFLYVAQQALFVVSEGGTIDTPEAKDTKIVVYAKNVRELTSRGPIDEIQKEYDSKIGELERKTGKDEITPSELLVLKEDISFLSKVLEVAKTSKR